MEMADAPPLAHSPRQGVPAQTYQKHVTNVRRRACINARRAVAFFSGDRETFVDSIHAAALYHDLGKLDSANQEVLRRHSKNPLPIAHEDAGTAELDIQGRQEAAVLAFGHHAGLFSREAEMAKQGRPFRELNRLTPNGGRVADHVDSRIAEYQKIHAEAGCPAIGKVDPKGLHECGFTRRMALSCLVDADHGDTARHSGKEIEIAAIKPCWPERLAGLQRYVQGLPNGTTERERLRNQLRRGVFEECRNAPLDSPVRTCDAPVGSGKTTAVMAHLLRVAAERKPQLRHIFVVLPYTNIITQSVEIYRKALTLEGERPEDIVAEHHHKADFANLELRQLATLWRAPIIVTTAVQFFETLGSHSTSRLRKLHELPGSAVFVDEMHAAMPSHLWPQMWRWLETWTRDWGGHLVLGSGSLARFWQLDEYRNLIREGGSNTVFEIPDLIGDQALRDELKHAENRRIEYKRRPDDAIALDCAGVVDFVMNNKRGPRLLIVNTVQTAAVIARTMREAGHNVLHLSTALAPVHRDVIVDRIKQRLRDGIENWTLVATSCVEAGMNFSFRVGFRERASTASLIQIGGRVSREDEFGDAQIWDILLRDDLFRDNPSISISRLALDHFSLDELNRLHPAELTTCAMRREWNNGAEEKARELIAYEKGMEYPSVGMKCRVIDSDTRSVVIDRALADTIRKGEKISKRELMRYSVQIWATKIEKLALPSIIGNKHSFDSGLFEWIHEYDSDFLGYMKGALALDDFQAAGGAVI